MSDVVGATFKIKLHDVKLLVRKMKISPSVLVAHAKALEIGNAKYPIRRVITKSFTISAGNWDFSQENVFSGRLPSRLTVAFIDNNAFNGAFDKNPFNFKNYYLTQIKIFIDGQAHQIKPIECNFPNNQSITGSMSLFCGSGKYMKDDGNEISREDYANGFTLYSFDLSPDLNGDDHFNLIKEGSIRIDVKFGTALPNTVNCIVHSEFENILEIDRNRSILFDYK